VVFKSDRMKDCQFCRSRIPFDAVTCAYCAQVVDTREAIETKLLMEKRAAQSRRKKTLVGFAFVFTFMIVSGLIGHQNETAPRNIANAERHSESLAKQIAVINQEKQQAAEQLAHPEKFVTIENFSWSKEGFGTVMEATFTIGNALQWAVKDIEIRCEHAAPSGTRIDSNTRTIYERIEAKGIRTIRNFNMGFIHSQATRSTCRIVRVVSLR
jgi:hypothetical protein